MDSIYQISVQNSKVISLPVFQKNEAKVSELKDVLRGIIKFLGYDPMNPDDFKILEEIILLFGGDEPSVRNAQYASPIGILMDRIAIARQMASLPQATLQYIEPVLGLFHFQLQFLTMLISKSLRISTRPQLHFSMDDPAPE